MRHHLVVSALMLACSSVAMAAPPASLDADVAAAMRDGPPGIAIAIVEDGKTTVARGFGVKRLGNNEPVGAQTLFEIGSTSKAFTAAALAILVESGELSWDDRVVDHMPEFQMYDPWVTREMRVKDLLVHRAGLGLGAGDLTFAPRTTHSRAEIMQALRWLKPETSFRTTFSYSNLLYVAAGQLIEKVSGQSWEAFVTERILTPAGMNSSHADGTMRFDTSPDRAQPHARLGPPFRGVGPLSVLDERRGLGSNVGPAGGIASNVEDMARWIEVQLSGGKGPSGTRLWSDQTANVMWTSTVPLPIPPATGPLADARPSFNSYALGWNVHDYHGARIITHAGGTLGFLTRVVLMPDQNVGFVIVQNSEDSHAMQALMYQLMDHYLGRPAADWDARFRAASIAGREIAEKALAAATTRTDAVPPPQLPHSALAASYRDAWYGPITVVTQGEGLLLSFTKTPGMTALLSHHSGDSYLARWDDAAIEPAIIEFHAGPDGKVINATLRAYSPAADFSFDFHDLDLRPEPQSRKSPQ